MSYPVNYTVNANTAPNLTDADCTIRWALVHTYWFYIFMVCSVASFAGNMLVIIIVYRNRRLRTIVNYCIVSMAVSDIFLPLTYLLHVVLFVRLDSGVLSQISGTALCKFTYFFWGVSYAVSMQSLVVVCVHRLYAVVSPMKARLERFRTCVLIIASTWVVAIATHSPYLYFFRFDMENQECWSAMSQDQRWIDDVVQGTLFLALPFIIMAVMYPLTIMKLRQQQVPGNCTSSHSTRRRKQNVKTTKMFVTIAVVYLITWGIDRILYFILNYSNIKRKCTVLKVKLFMDGLPSVFHAINPTIYFVYCSVYRKGLNDIFSRFISICSKLQNSAENKSVEVISTSDLKFRSDDERRRFRAVLKISTNQ